MVGEGNAGEGLLECGEVGRVGGSGRVVGEVLGEAMWALAPAGAAVARDEVGLVGKGGGMWIEGVAVVVGEMVL